jgi:putative endonuclease
MRTYYVYILGNDWGTIYTGVTNDIHRRMEEHKKGTLKGFTNKYKIHRLLYVEEFNSVDEAINAEKTIKGWTRKTKMNLIRSMNPKFEDLSIDWG